MCASPVSTWTFDNCDDRPSFQSPYQISMTTTRSHRISFTTFRYVCSILPATAKTKPSYQISYLQSKRKQSVSRIKPLHQNVHRISSSTSQTIPQIPHGAQPYLERRTDARLSADGRQVRCLRKLRTKNQISIHLVSLAALNAIPERAYKTIVQSGARSRCL